MISTSACYKMDSGLYMLSGRDIDFIGNMMASGFDQTIIDHAHPFAIEDYVEIEQEYNVDYFCLTPERSILGCAVPFGGVIPAWNISKNEYEDKYVLPNTVVIDERLVTSDDEKDRLTLRFVMAHELMHLLFQKNYLRMTKGKLPYLHTDENHYRTRLSINFNDDDLCEWQANRGAISLLMPLQSVQKHIKKMKDILPGYDMFPEVMIREIARTYQVPRELAYYRLVDLPIFQYYFGKVNLKDLQLD